MLREELRELFQSLAAHLESAPRVGSNPGLQLANASGVIDAWKLVA